MKNTWQQNNKSRQANSRSVGSYTGQVIFVLLSCWLWVSSPSLAAPLRVTVLQTERGGNAFLITETLRTHLPSDRYQIETTHAGEPIKPSDLYIAIGMKAALELTDKGGATLCLQIPKAGFEAIQRDFPANGIRRSAIFLEQPKDRQAKLLRGLFPKATHVGLIHTNAIPDMRELEQALAEQKFKLHRQQAEPGEALYPALEEVLRKSDILLAWPDPEIYNIATMRNVLLMTYNKKLPTFGFSPSFVKAGGLVAIFSTPQQIGQQAARMVEQFVETGSLPKARYPDDYEFIVNTQVARSLELRLTDSETLRSQLKDRR